MSGIQPHSMPVRPGPYTIFATTAYPDEAVREEFAVNSIRFKALEGVFDGHKETSWIVHSDDFQRVQHLAEGEQCVLHLMDTEPGQCGARKAWLQGIHDGRMKFLGWFTEVGQAYAERQSAYTFDRQQWRWWAVLPSCPVPYVEKQRPIRLGKLLSKAELAVLNA